MNKKLCNILAIDPSVSKTGYCIIKNNLKFGEKTFRDEEIEIKTFSPISKHKVERLDEIKKFFDKLVYNENIDYIIIEGYSYGSKGRSIITLGELGGVLRVSFYNNVKKFIEIPPTVWKKILFNKGNLKKEHVLMKTFKKFNREFEDNNECDAFCLGMVGQKYFNDEIDEKTINKIGVLK